MCTSHVACCPLVSHAEYADGIDGISPDHFLTNCFPFLVLYAVYRSGLAVLYLGHSK